MSSVRVVQDSGSREYIFMQGSASDALLLKHESSMDCNRGHLGLSIVLKHILPFQSPNRIADKSLPSVLSEARSALSLTEVSAAAQAAERHTGRHSARRYS